MEDKLIWVDDMDRETGSGGKYETHRDGRLHRAFSVFVFNTADKTMLLQRRAPGKYHSGGLWTNACCSHPRVGEELSAAVERRMKEELGLPRGCLSAENGNRVPIEIGKFRYRCDFGGVIENEIDHVFILAADRARIDLRPDPAEIAELRWYAIGEIDRLLAVTPEKFTVWFPKAYSIARDYVHGK